MTINHLLPRYAVSLHITHNDHKINYHSAEEWAATNDEREFAEWVSAEERARAIATDSIWMVQWFPDTPVGSYVVVASTLEAALEAARRSG